MTRTNQSSATGIPAILCLAAGASQLVVIEKARQLGYAVIAVDRDPQAPGFICCDAAIQASTYEAEPILAQLPPLLETYHLQGVINRSSGLPVITAAKICRSLGLPGPDPTVAATLTDKSRLIPACRSVGIPVPWCRSGAALDRMDLTRISYPCVVKPAISLVGKSGITVVKKAGDLPNAFAAALAVSLNQQVNLEEFLPGGDVSLVALVGAGTVHPLVLKDELTAVRPDGGIRFAGVAVPSVFSDDAAADRILALAEQVVTAFRLRNTVLNLSCRCEPGGTPRLIEIHLDLGGDLFYESLAPAATETDLLGLMIEFLTGRTTNFPQPEFSPTALVFDQTAEQKPGRPYTIVNATTRQDLANRITAQINS